MRVTYGWHTSTYEWHTDDIGVHTTDIRMAYEYGCSFVAKLTWKKIIFFLNIFVFLTKYTLFAEKNVLI